MDFVTTPSTLIVHAIQDVAPFLPLIATGLCETHVTTALDNGLLYPAAAPMSIFGSLGIAMAGAIALLASIDWPIIRFHGPTHLKNAGLRPTGLGTLLLHVNERKHHLHVAEDRLRTILSKKKVRSVSVNLLSRDLFLWNICLIAFTALFSSLGLLPYVPLYFYSLHDRPFLEIFLPPFLRVFGAATVAVSVQLLFQLRLLEEAYHRLRFLAADTYLKDAGTSLPPFWDPNQRSKSVFAQLRLWLEGKKTGVSGGGDNPNTESGTPPEGPQPKDTVAGASSQGLQVADAEMFLKKIHRLHSFNFEVEAVGAPENPGQPTPSPEAPRGHSSTQELNDAERSTRGLNGAPNPPLWPEGEPQAARLALWIAHRLTTIGLCIVQILLLGGVGCILYGYVLCFSLVQANRNAASWKGPVLWLVLEIVLALIRIAIWAWNPDIDDPRSPIVLEKVSDDDTGEPTPKNKTCSYAIGWSLSSLTADDMHALVIGIDDYKTWGLPKDLWDLTGAADDARKMAEYLEEKLHVPCHQIHTLYNSQATKERIVEELNGLNHRGSVAKDAPIVIYYAGHSYLSLTDNSTYLVPCLLNYAKKMEDRAESDMLMYGEVVELLRHIGDEKTENIVLILDTCHAGAMAVAPPTPEGTRFPTYPEDTQPILAAEETAGGSHTTGSPPSITVFLAPESNASHNPDDSLATACAGSVTSSGAIGQISRRPSSRPSGTMRGKARDILAGHPSHVLLAATAAGERAYEASCGKGGQFTAALLHALANAESNKALKSMTYKKLIDGIGEYTNNADKPLKEYQWVHCTTIHQERPLFDGLFARKRDDESSIPVVTVRYKSDWARKLALSPPPIMPTPDDMGSYSLTQRRHAPSLVPNPQEDHAHHESGPSTSAHNSQ